MDWTFVCPTEIVEFSDRIDDFKEENCEVTYQNDTEILSYTTKFLEFYHIFLLS